jgi:hypothetical protein
MRREDQDSLPNLILGPAQALALVRDGERDPAALGLTTHLAHTRAASALSSVLRHLAV